MKKIVVLLLVIVTVVLSVPVSAASSSLSDIIYEEIIQLIDIKEFGANLSDDEVYLIAVMESGYTEKGFTDDTTLYVYLYNPSRKDLSKSNLGTISIVTKYDSDGKPVDFKKYPLVIEGSTVSGLYTRARVNVNAKDLAYIRDGSRWYGVTEIEYLDSVTHDMDVTPAGTVYKFSGYGSDLKCECENFVTIELDVRSMSYLTGDAPQAGYSNQVASVYFSIPQEFEEKYGKLYAVYYEYYKYRTKPVMFYTNDIYPAAGEQPENLNVFYSIQICKMVGSHGAMAPQWQYYCDAPLLGFHINEYVVGKQLVSSAEFEKGFSDFSKVDQAFGGKLIAGKYSEDLFDLTVYSSNNHKVSEYRTRDEIFDMPSYHDSNKWYDRLRDFGLFYNSAAHDETLEDVKYIQPVTTSSFLVDDFSKEYLVAEEEVETLHSYVSNAWKNGENTYLLRFAHTDNYHVVGGSGYRLAYDDPFSNEVAYSDVWLVEEDVYLQFDIFKLDFSDDGKEITTFGVAAASINIFPAPGGIQTGKDQLDLDSDLSWLYKLAAVLLIGALGFSVIWVIGLFGQLGEASTNRQILRELRRRNRK